MSFRLDTEKGGLRRNAEDGGRAGKEPKVELICPVCGQSVPKSKGGQGSKVERYVK